MVLLTGLGMEETSVLLDRLDQPDLPANFDFSRATTAGGTKGDTSPPMEAICRTSVAVIGRTAGRRRQEHGLDVRRHGAVHARHFHLVVEIGAAAQPADQDARALALGGRHHQIGKRDAAKLAPGLARNRRAGLVQHRQPLVGAEQRRLARVRADRQHQPFRKPRRLRARYRDVRSSPGRRSREKGRCAACRRSNPQNQEPQGCFRRLPGIGSHARQRGAPGPFSPWVSTHASARRIRTAMERHALAAAAERLVVAAGGSDRRRA